MRAVVLRESGSFKEICHLCHFVELLMVAFVEMMERDWPPESIQAVIMPDWQTPNWRGRAHEHNRILIQRCFPQAVISTACDGPRIQPSESLVIDRADLRSRRSSQPQVAYVQRLDNRAWFDRIHGPLACSPDLVVTYISRQHSASRCLHPAIDRRLCQRLGSLPGIEFREVFMEDHDFDSQLRIAGQTDVLIGAHGNGMTHCMFMPPKRFVCEIFPQGATFHWHYYTFSRAMDHEYMCMFNGQAMTAASFSAGRVSSQSASLDMLDIEGMVELARDQILKKTSRVIPHTSVESENVR
jgi:hypothetical protein